MGGAVQIEGMPGGAAMMGGAVQIGEMPEMPSAPSEAGFLIEYSFVKPIKYSGYRIVTSKHTDPEFDPMNWRIIVDCVNQETGEREEQNLEI